MRGGILEERDAEVAEVAVGKLSAVAEVAVGPQVALGGESFEVVEGGVHLCTFEIQE